jgi:hypothetical protein
VDLSTLSITLSAPVFYLNDSANSIYSNIIGMNEQQYVLVYHDSIQNGNDANVYGTYGTLNAILVTIPTFDSVNEIATLKVVLSKVVTLFESQASFYMALTRLDGDSAVVAYVDARSNFGVTAQVIEILKNDSSYTSANPIGSYCFVLFSLLFCT